MSYDQVIGAGGYWNPSILGAGSYQGAGEGNYDMPSGTEIDTSVQILPLVTPIAAGSISGWPTLPSYPYRDTTAVPSMAQIAAGSGINQVLGLLNRRIVLWNALSLGSPEATTMAPQAYVSATGSVAASKFTGIYASITALLLAEGLPTYAASFPPGFPSNVLASHLVYAYHVAHMRRALLLTGYQNLAPNTYWTYGRYAPTPPTFTEEDYQLGSLYVNTFAGISGGAIGERVIFYYGIPEYVGSGPNFSSAQFYLYSSGTNVATSWNLELFHYNATPVLTATGGYVSYVGNGAAFAGGATGYSTPADGSIASVSIPSPYGYFSVAVNEAAIVAHAGGYAAWLMGTDEEISGAYGPNGSYYANATASQYLQLYWG